MNKKVAIIVLVFSLFSILSLSVNLTSVNDDYLQLISDENTTEFSATVTGVELPTQKDDKIVHIYTTENFKLGTIYTEEYGDKICLAQISRLIDPNDLLNLHTGEKIFFRVDNTWAGSIDETSLVYILTLRTRNEEIVSINRSSNQMKEMTFSLKFFMLICLVVLSVVVGYCIYRLVKIHRLEKWKRELNGR